MEAMSPPRPAASDAKARASLLILLWKKFLRNYREDSWGAITKSCKALLSPAFERNVYRVYVRELGHSRFPLPQLDDDLELVLLDPENRCLIDQVEAQAEWLEGHVAARLAAGDICVAVVQGKTLAGFNLITFNDAYIPLLRTTRRFRPNSAWSDHISVSPQFRRRGIAKALRLQVFAELASRGIHKLYGGALSGNRPSLQLARSLGFRELADVTYRKFGFKKSWRCRRCPALPRAPGS